MTVSLERVSLLDQAPDVLWPWLLGVLCEQLGPARVSRCLLVDVAQVKRYLRGELPSARVRECATRLFAQELAAELGVD